MALFIIILSSTKFMAVDRSRSLPTCCLSLCCFLGPFVLLLCCYGCHGLTKVLLILVRSGSLSLPTLLIFCKKYSTVWRLHPFWRQKSLQQNIVFRHIKAFFFFFFFFSIFFFLLQRFYFQVLLIFPHLRHRPQIRAEVWLVMQ